MLIANNMFISDSFKTGVKTLVEFSYWDKSKMVANACHSTSTDDSNAVSGTTDTANTQRISSNDASQIADMQELGKAYSQNS